VTFAFDPTKGLIIVEAEVAGPATSVTVHLALDTGATDSFLDEDWVALAGYTPADATNKFDVLTASGTITVLEVPLRSLTVLGQARTNFPIQAHSFPPGTGHDGVLGLDFRRGSVLTIDFINGEITLAPGSPAGATP
jgi:predicted aspartyl protease